MSKARSVSQSTLRCESCGVILNEAPCYTENPEGGLITCRACYTNIRSRNRSSLTGE